MADYSLRSKDLENANHSAPTGNYFNPKRVSQHAQEVIRRHVAGFSNQEIAELVGISTATVGNILRSNFGKSQAANLQAAANYDAVEVTKQMREMIPQALQVLGGILEDGDAPSSVRLRAAQDLLDRTGHSAVKKVDVHSTNLSLTPEQLESIKIKAMELVPDITLPAGEGSQCRQ